MDTFRECHSKKIGLTAEKVADVFLEHCVCRMGLPNEIVSDHDHLFSSAFLTTMCEKLGIEQRFSITYRPRGNGRAENAVKATIHMLRLLLVENTQPWLLLLPWATFTYNSLPGILTPMSPHFIVFGGDPPFVGDVPPVPQMRSSLPSKAWTENILELPKTVSDKLRRQHDQIRSRFLKQKVHLSFEPGYRVWLKETKRTSQDKLLPVWTGPCEII